MKMFNSTKDMVITSLLIGLVFIFTKFINIRLPISINGGLIHMGTVMLVITSINFGKKKGAISGAFGMAIFDIVSGWTAWAPFTFVVRGVMGYIIGRISEKKDGKSVIYNFIAVIIGGIWMIGGYYLTEYILYGNFFAPVTSIPGNAIQIALALVIGIPLSLIIKKSNVNKYI
ncbi:ECF transporter S component [Clostridium sp. D2Q-11]|uniref:ECF transporter S component n=2 Tax=Anaeromonas frigoriresistens TaxID=2683708 RepID=A0A942UVW5_9FIRM|nr:ECF transporter S component [Anaeromonas frigoriresistens]MBS4539025.1 ECF transporter S component [Anaeromonas frigoriresistens]